MGYKNVPLYKKTVIHYWSDYVNWKFTCAMITEPPSRSSWVAHNGRVVVARLLTLIRGLITPITTPQIKIMTFHSSALQPLLYWLVSILQIFLYIYIVHYFVILITLEVQTVKHNTSIVRKTHLNRDMFRLYKPAIIRPHIKDSIKHWARSRKQRIF
jgi:hypothetical protein